MNNDVCFRPVAVLAGCAVLVLLLTTCRDFFGAEDLKELIREDVKTATAPTVTVTFRAEDDNMGVPTPYGAQTLRVGIPVNITTTVGQNYSFERWTHTGGATDITFGDPASISTTVTVNVAKDGIVVIPAFTRRPHPLTWDPYTGNTGVITNKAITATFNQQIDPASLVLAPDGTIQVQTWWSGTPGEPIGIEHTLRVAADGALISITLRPGHFFQAFHTVRVTLSPEIRNLDGVRMAEEFSWFFTTGSGQDLQPPVITSFRIRKATGEAGPQDEVDVYTNDRLIRILIEAIDDQQQVRWLEVNETPDGGETVSTVYDFTGDLPHQLSRLDDGLTAVLIRVADESENWSTATANPPLNQKRVHLDTAPPIVSGFRIGSNGYTNTDTVSVTIETADGTGSPLARYRLTETVEAPLAWNEWPPPSSVTLSTGDGQKRVYLHVRDAAGNVSHADDTILLDTVPPSLAVGSISTTGNEYFVRNGQSVTIALQVTDDASGLAGPPTVTIAGRSAVVTGTHPDYEATHEFTGTAAIEGPVVFTVSALDNAGNALMHTGTTSIVYDRTAPQIISFPAPEATNSSLLSVLVNANDTGSGIASYAVDGPGVAVPYVAATSSTSHEVSFSLSEGDESKQVTLAVMDAAGNAATLSRAVELDTIRPTVTVGEATTDGNDGYVRNDQTITLAFEMTETGSGLSGDPIVTLAGQTAVISGSYPGFVASHLFTGDVASQGEVEYTINASDNAGNSMFEEAGSTGILYDRDPPSIEASPGGLIAEATIISGFLVTDAASGVDDSRYTVSPDGDAQFDGAELMHLVAPSHGTPREYEIGASDLAGNETTVVVRHSRTGSDTFEAEIVEPEP